MFFVIMNKIYRPPQLYNFKKLGQKAVLSVGSTNGGVKSVASNFILKDV